MVTGKGQLPRFACRLLTWGLLATPPAAAQTAAPPAGATAAPPSAQTPPSSPTQTERPPSACGSPEHRQFDFWLGNWDTYELPDTTSVVARLQVTRMLEGCAIRELYEQRNGLIGESVSLWDAARRRWHQSWVTNQGALLLLDGGFEDGRMVLTAEERRGDGSSGLIRGTWWRQGHDVRQRAERSSDGGRTWSPAWDIVFRPRTPG